MNAHDERGDSELLGGLRSGDTAALAALYDRHGRAAYGLAFLILGHSDAAEAVVQAAFFTLWRAASTDDRPDPNSVRAWLLVRVHQHAIADLRRRPADRRPACADLLARLLAPALEADGQAVETGAGARMRAALRQLPPDQQRAVTFAYFGGYTLAEIASCLGLSPAAARCCLRQSLQALARVPAPNR